MDSIVMIAMYPRQRWAYRICKQPTLCHPNVVR